jgi:AcrR family transcriptional regulator
VQVRHARDAADQRVNHDNVGSYFGYGYAIANMRSMPPSAPRGKGRRPYRSPRRAVQAQRTRQRIIAAATDQFAANGYAATTIRAVAAAAGVSIPSVELAFGTKAQLLKTAIDVAIAGDDAPVPVLDRDWATRARATEGAVEFLAAVGRVVRPAMSRSAGLVLAVFEAAPTDADMQDLADRLAAQRATTVAWIVDGLRQHAALRAGLNRRHAIDQLWLLMDPAVYQRLTRYRGWRPAQYERWLVDSIARLLLD